MTPRSPLGAAHTSALAGQLAAVGERSESQPYGAEASAAAGGVDGDTAAGTAADAGWDPEGQPAEAQWGGIDPTGNAAWQQPEQPESQPEGQAWGAVAAEQQQWDGADQEYGANAAAAEAAAPEVYSDEQVSHIAPCLKSCSGEGFERALVWPDSS